MNKYATKHIYYVGQVFYAELNHRTKSFYTLNVQSKTRESENQSIGMTSSSLSTLGHDPHVLTSPFHPFFCFQKVRGGTTEFVCGTKKVLRVTKREVHFSITYLRFQLPPSHDNSKTTTDFSHAAQADCKISIK